jgi:hypothetical protein
MEKKDTVTRKVGRGAIAVLMALFVVAVGIPNAGHFVVHPTVSPQTVFESSFRDRLSVFVFPVIALVCIFAGMFRRPMLEYVGWGLLIIFVVWSL